MGVFLKSAAHSNMPIPIRFAFFAMGTLLWTEVSEESEAVFRNTALKQYTAKPVAAHPPLETSERD